MKKRSIHLAVACVAMLVAMSAQVRGGVIDIRIDLSTSVGSTSGNWNNISNLTGLTTNLIDFGTGLGTGVSIDGSGSPWLNFLGDNGATFPNVSWVLQPSTMDGAGLSNGATGVFSLAGLGGSSYTVEVLSARTTFGYLNTITVDGLLASRTFLGTSVNTPWNSTSDGLTPGNWLIWDNVNPTFGAISIQDIADLNTLGMLNAIRIVENTTAVPEPSTFALFCMGAIVLISCRRRNRQHPV